MRRALAAAILGISLWVGSLAWTGFVLSRTVLDPDRSQDVAQTLYEDDAVRTQLAGSIAAAIDAAIPAEAGVPGPVIEDAAVEALESPAVEAVFVDALVRTHRAFLGEGDAPEAVEAGAFGVAARGAIVAGRPELDRALPEAPSLRIPLPTERVPDFGPVRDVVRAAVPVLAGLAATGSVLALVVTSNRPAVIRRAGVWAIGLSAAVLFFAYGIPVLATRFVPAQSEVVAALVGAIAAATRGPALALAVTGLAAIGLSVVWKAAPSMAAVVPSGGSHERAPRGPERAEVARTGRRDVPTPGRRPVPAGNDATTAMAAGPRSQRPAASTPVWSARRWVDGAGRVLDASEPIPAEARWVPGVGYVVDE